MRRPLHLAALITLATPAAAQSAGCAAQLDWATTFASRNYAGFADKIMPATRPAYDSLLTALRVDAASAATDAACDTVLRRWTAFFHDGHLGFQRRGAADAPTAATRAPSDSEVRARFASWERVPLDERSARERLTALGAARDPVEGVWLLTDGRYRVAVLRDAARGDYAMTILAADSVWWTPGQVKARLARDTGEVYRTRFFMRDHSEQPWTARVARNVLTTSTGMTFVRQWPQAPGDVSVDAVKASYNARFVAREVAPGTVLVQLPTFNDPKGIDSLFAAEGDRIRAAETLVVDVRGNGGGSDYNYRHLLPLLYTRPIKSVGMMALATDANIAATEALANDSTIPEGQRVGIRWTVSQMKQHRNDWWIGNDGTTTFPQVLERPRRVAVLSDRGCASSCEQFLLAARQSDKVTIYGDRSAGILDYANVRSSDMPGANLTLRYPVTRSKRLPSQPVDGIGIAPHVRMPADEVLPVEWVLARLKK